MHVCMYPPLQQFPCLAFPIKNNKHSDMTVCAVSIVNMKNNKTD